MTLSNDSSVKSPSSLHTLKAYLDLEPINLQELEIKPIPIRNTSKEKLTTWVSAFYHTQGDRLAIDNEKRRLDEWI